MPDGRVALDLVDYDAGQPRRYVDPARLAELAESIDANGLAQPVLLRPAGNRYVIVAGERRVRAARRLEWSTIPAVVRDVDSADVPWVQLAENLQRADLSSVEEALAYRQLVDAGHGHAAIAARVGKSRSYVTQKLRLLDLPGFLVEYLERNVLNEGHVRQLLRLKAALDGVTVADVVSCDTDWDDKPAPFDMDDVGYGIVLFRPLDWPALYPVLPDADHPRIAVIVAATEALYAELTPTTEWWTAAAWWWGTVTVAIELTVAQLDRQLDRWFDSIVSAFLNIGKGRNIYSGRPTGADGLPEGSDGVLTAMEIFGYHADLRHAGLRVWNSDSERADRWLVGPGERSFRRLVTKGSVAAPSIFQPGAPDHEWWSAMREKAGL